MNLGYIWSVRLYELDARFLGSGWLILVWHCDHTGEESHPFKSSAGKMHICSTPHIDLVAEK